MKTLCTLHCISADPFLGKIDKHSLSHQTLMELLIEGFTINKEKICGDTTEITDIAQWEGVDLNTEHEVVEIDWSEEDIEGSVQLKWLPPTVTSVSLSYNELRGSVDLTCLPGSLKALEVEHNLFEGTIDLTKLPFDIRIIDLSSNNFTRVTDFSQLPKSLRCLFVQDTCLAGEVREFPGTFRNVRSYVRDMREHPY